MLLLVWRSANALQFPFSAYTLYGSYRPNKENNARKKKREARGGIVVVISESSELAVSRVVPRPGLEYARSGRTSRPDAGLEPYYYQVRIERVVSQMEQGNAQRLRVRVSG